MLESIYEHSVRTDLLAPGEPVLDVGARNFAFSKELVRRGFEVYAMEPDPYILDPGLKGLTLIRRALVWRQLCGPQPLAMFGNGTGNHLLTQTMARPSECTVVAVECEDLETVMWRTGIGSWGLVKLDCEGCEYDILRTWPGPVAKEISVEFHDHIGANPHKDDPERIYRVILDHLAPWYTAVQHERSVRHCIGTPNYWDTLFVLTNLL